MSHAAEKAVADIDARVDAMLRAESGKPLVRAAKEKPLAPGRGNYVRWYSYSIMAFAARCLVLGERLDEANAALAENAQHYLDHPRDINDRDSFHWHGEIVLRLIELYGANGSRRPGRITAATEATILRPVWLYAKQFSSLAKAEYRTSRTWHVYSSENHHLMDFTIHWHFAKLAKDRPEYRDLPFDDGATAAEHHRAWNDYFLVYCLERARKGLCVEMMNSSYNTVWIKGLYSFHDFGDDAVSRAAGMLLDTYFAYWAQEQIDGVQGGGRSRITLEWGLGENHRHGMAPLAWLYFGIGEQPPLRGYELGPLLSSYRPPVVVADIALDIAGRGRYEVRQRPQGLGDQGACPPQLDRHSRPNRLRTDGGGILRYTFCDPAFIIGTPMTAARPSTDWAAISTQNRWQGVIFAGSRLARIVPIVRPADDGRALNAQWSVQSRGSLITQKCQYHRHGAEMMVWMPIVPELIPRLERDGVVFIEAPHAWAAIRVAGGAYTWQDGPAASHTATGDIPLPPGRALVPDQEYAPVILEVMARSDCDDFTAFTAKVLAAAPTMAGSILEYTTIYGDRLTFDTGSQQTPTINGAPVNYAPPKALESPFLNADYDRGIVTITKGSRRKVLDFNQPANELA